MQREIVGVLCDIRSVHNVGSIFRTADGAGVAKLYLCGITPAPVDIFGYLRKDFAKVALGAEVPWEHRVSPAALIAKLKKQGYEICAVEQAQDAIHYKEYTPRSKRIAFVYGNEVKGLSRAMRQRADATLEIPMRGTMVGVKRRVHGANAHHVRLSGGGKESLNVAVVFGIISYHFASMAPA